MSPISGRVRRSANKKGCLAKERENKREKESERKKVLIDVAQHGVALHGINIGIRAFGIGIGHSGMGLGH
jgi:hypothetical protein